MPARQTHRPPGKTGARRGGTRRRRRGEKSRGERESEREGLRCGEETWGGRRGRCFCEGRWEGGGGAAHGRSRAPRVTGSGRFGFLAS